MANQKLKKQGVRIPTAVVRDMARRLLLAAGADLWVAKATADGLWHASLRGTDSHGIRLLSHYLAGLEGGRINPSPEIAYRRTTFATGTLDADHTFGHAAGVRAMEEAIVLARETGAGFVSVSNSSHCGAMAYFGLRACDEDMIGLALTHASPKMMTPGSVRSFFGTNPICVCAPMMDESPFCFDSAPTILTSNRLNILAEAGLELPPEVAADADGNYTLDPRTARQLIPIGGYKGFGLAMVVDIFCALLAGMPAGPDVSMMFLDSLNQKRFLGQFYGAIRIDAFADPVVFKRRLKELCQGIRSQPCRDGADPPMAPGDPEKQAEADRSKNGIPVPASLLEELAKLARKWHVEPLSQTI